MMKDISGMDKKRGLASVMTSPHMVQFARDCS